jgi:hypothetical protein
MDKRAAAQYLDKLFGTRTGYVAVAYKDKGQSWQEHQFSWPRDKNKLIGWAEVHQDANVFICPALRQDAHTRKKGDMHPSRWLWADVDWQNVPEGKRDEVHSRINELGTYIIASGSGDNAHVYVELDKPVPHEEFIKLNTGLRDYLYADNKQADNSLLRLPGTTNWKTDAGSPVAERGGNGRKTTQATLLKRRIFRDAKVITDVDAQEWSFVEVEGLPRRVRAMVEMDVPQAENRYGSRFKAVWAITGELHKRGLGVDEIHSLMDKFPPALSKAADENGYDVHRDVDKRIAWDRTKASVVDDDEMDEDAGDVFEEMSVEEVESSRLTELAEQIRLRMRARRLAEQLEAASGYTRPPDDTTTWLSDALKQPPAPVQWLIEGLCSADATVVIAGQYKTGKTKLMIASLISALIDGELFLGSYPVHVPDGGAKVGHWNLEMSATDLIDKYMRPVGYRNPQNVKLANWRGQPGNILTELGMVDAVSWLTGLDVWTIDSWTALCRMCGVDPNSGKEVGQLLARIEEIKVQSGVRVCFFLAHTARASAESDRPGTRGASELDDHVDSRWMLTVDKSDVRFMQAQGRDTDMSPVSLDFNEDTGQSTIGAITRAGAATDGWVQLIVKTLKDMAGKGLNESTLVKKLKEARPIGVVKAKEYIAEAIDAGFIQVVEESRPGGGRTMKMHYLVGSQPPENDRFQAATIREVNLTGVAVKGRRK